MLRSAKRRTSGVVGLVRVLPRILPDHSRVRLQPSGGLCAQLRVGLFDGCTQHRHRQKHVPQEKKDKYERCAVEMGATHHHCVDRFGTHLPFVVETMGGLSASAVHLLQEIHHTASTANTWRDADRLGAHMLNTIAIAVQECTGRSIRASNLREQELAFGPQAA